MRMIYYWPRLLAAGIVALMLGITSAMSGETAISCTNPASGASFQIKIDYERGTVDANPAELTERTISRRDENHWNYTLDRKSGNLTIVRASAAGGEFLHDNCKPGN